MTRPLQLTAAAAAIAAAFLTACGGGTSTPAAEKTSEQVSPSNSAAAANATATGATAISTDANKLVFDLVADVGDSWQMTLDKTAKTFVLKVVQTQYDVPETTGTFTSSTASGGRITYTLTDTAKNAIGTLTADDATQSAAGNIEVKASNGNAVSTAVSGTAFKATALEKLAGTYNFVRASRNAGNGQHPDSGAGQALIAADGKTMKLCLLGTFVNGTCTSIVGEGTPEEGTLNLALDSFGRIAVSSVIDGVSTTFGLGSIVASDLGKAFLIDRYGKNEEGVMRTGAFYLAEAKKVSTSVADGTWHCYQQGKHWNTLTLKGESGQSTNIATGAKLDAKFTYNGLHAQHMITNEFKFFNWNGIMSGGASTDALSEYTDALALSSTLMVHLSPEKRARVCNKTGS